ncbi:hypothetical protein H0H92_011848 [Tricholoma furcatifolium]|nr:hypothetical protein H0H92_011848 [Tricholoma furcatifolium]
MPGKEWATPDQSAFLLEDLNRYRDCQADQSYRGFWDYKFEAWELKFPERAALFPDLGPSDALDEAQEQSLSDAIRKRQQQIISWYRWRTQKKARKAEQKKIKTMMKIIHGSRSRLPQVMEIYSDMFYDTKIAPIVKDDMPAGANRSERLTVIKRVTRDLWLNETSDVVEQVNARLAQLKAAKAEKLANPPELPTAEEITENLDDLPAVMGRFLEYLESITGWSFSCLMGGPDPELKGKVRVASYHVGETPGGKAFNVMLRNFDQVVMGPYLEFVNAVHPEAPLVDEIPAAADVVRRVLQDVSVCSPETPLSLSDKNATNSTEEVVQDQPSQPPSTVAQAPNTGLATTSNDASPHAERDMSSTTPDASPHAEEARPVAGALALTVPLGSHAAANVLGKETVATSPEPASGMLGTDGQASSNSGQSDWCSSNGGNATWPDVGAVMSSLYDRPNGHTADNYQAPQPVDEFSTLGTYDFGLGFNFDLGLIPPTNVDLLDASLAPPSFLGPHSSLSVLSSGFNALPAPFSQPAITPTSVEATFGQAPAPLGAQPVQQAPVSAPPVLEGPPIQLETIQLESAPAAPDISSLTVQSRSGRTITPSTRNDQLNKIGSNPEPPKPAGKENVPLSTTLTAPDWLIAAREHLTMQDLGETWKSCVAEWERFEEALDYHCGKGLPGAKDRPEEWAAWVTKSHRMYSRTPVIADPMEFGLATAKWWKGIQPKVRQTSPATLPVPIIHCPAGKEDIWASLRKGGPNGMLVVMTLLVWWGQRLGTTSQWQEDSSALWKECVDDVRACLEVMAGTANVAPLRGHKRSGPATKGTQAKR